MIWQTPRGHPQPFYPESLTDSFSINPSCAGLSETTPKEISGIQILLDHLIPPLYHPDWEPHIVAHLDDVIIATDTYEEHLEWLKKILTRLKKANLEINRDESEFCCSEVQCLGFLINKDGMIADLEKIELILSYSPTLLQKPTNNSDGS